jgi:hypothetical protein
MLEIKKENAVIGTGIEQCYSIKKGKSSPRYGS